MQGDQPDGLIEAATPGTPEAAAFNQAMADELEAQHDLAERFGADADRLSEVLA